MTETGTPPDRTKGPFSLGPFLVLFWAIPAALAILETYTFAKLSGRPFSLVSIALREGTNWATIGVVAPFIYRLANRFPLTRSTLRSRLALHFVGVLILSAITAATATAAMQFTITSADLPQLRNASALRMFASWSLSGLPLAVLSYFAIVGVAHAISYFNEARQQREDALKLEGQLADARLAALQGRLHPHFLYNTLNAITVLVRDGDIARSTRMLELLSTMLRRVLDSSLPQIISLETELELLRQYLEIEEVRFSDRLTISIDVDDATLNAGVPALVTQPLAENVIRHAVAQTSKPVTLRIAAHVIADTNDKILELTVEDDGPGLAPGWERRQLDRTGLSATTLRLSTLYGKRASLQIRERQFGGAVSVVRIPFTLVSDSGERAITGTENLVVTGTPSLVG
jgi:sensor histidine kinase YesM